MEEKPRTVLQNSAMHLWFTRVAEALNAAGYGVKKVIRLDIPFTPVLVKELLWRTVQEKMLGKHSTKELTTKDIDKIYDTINRALAEISNGNIHVPFPSEEEMLARLEQEDELLRKQNPGGESPRNSIIRPVGGWHDVPATGPSDNAIPCPDMGVAEEGPRDQGEIRRR